MPRVPDKASRDSDVKNEIPVDITWLVTCKKQDLTPIFLKSDGVNSHILTAFIWIH